MGSAAANMAAPTAPPPLTDFKLGRRRRRLLFGVEAPLPFQGETRHGTNKAHGHR